MDLNGMDLGPYGAPGFELSDRLDMSGHRDGSVDPHINSEVIDSEQHKVCRDLAANQLPGWNGMQSGG